MHLMASLLCLRTPYLAAAAILMYGSNIVELQVRCPVHHSCRWYEDVLPGAISSRAPDAHITAAELVQLVS